MTAWKDSSLRTNCHLSNEHGPINFWKPPKEISTSSPCWKTPPTASIHTSPTQQASRNSASTSTSNLNLPSSQPFVSKSAVPLSPSQTTRNNNTKSSSNQSPHNQKRLPLLPLPTYNNNSKMLLPPLSIGSTPTTSQPETSSSNGSTTTATPSTSASATSSAWTTSPA